MATPKSAPKLNQVQLDLLKLFSRDLTDAQMLHIRRALVRELATLTAAQAEEDMARKNLRVEDVDAMADESDRTVQEMRRIREQVNREIQNMTFEEERAYLDRLLAGKQLTGNELETEHQHSPS